MVNQASGEDSYREEHRDEEPLLGSGPMRTRILSKHISLTAFPRPICNYQPDTGLHYWYNAPRWNTIVGRRPHIWKLCSKAKA